MVNPPIGVKMNHSSFIANRKSNKSLRPSITTILTWQGISKMTIVYIKKVVKFKDNSLKWTKSFFVLPKHLETLPVKFLTQVTKSIMRTPLHMNPQKWEPATHRNDLWSMKRNSLKNLLKSNKKCRTFNRLQKDSPKTLTSCFSSLSRLWERTVTQQRTSCNSSGHRSKVLGTCKMPSKLIAW